MLSVVGAAGIQGRRRKRPDAPRVNGRTGLGCSAAAGQPRNNNDDDAGRDTAMTTSPLPSIVNGRTEEWNVILRRREPKPEDVDGPPCEGPYGPEVRKDPFHLFGLWYRLTDGLVPATFHGRP